MRVIAGEAHGRRLRAPRGMTTRPATGRVRESIFSRIAARADIAGMRVLDLFAGSGSLALEALSRGAASAVRVESSRAAAAAIRDNLATLGLADRARVIVASVERALVSLKDHGDQFDLVFIDAPYRHDSSARVLETLAASAMLAAGAFVMVRQSDRAAEPLEGGPLARVSYATLGGHRLALFRAP